VQDGPGPGQRDRSPPIKIDAAAGAEPDNPPGGTEEGADGTPTSPDPAAKPEVEDQKLNNILNNLYKGVDNPNRTGDGTTADAVRHERATGEDVGGRNHTIKAQESVQALNNWLKSHPDAPVHERAVAETERANLIEALES
jgi:hypothetical protein